MYIFFCDNKPNYLNAYISADDIQNIKSTLSSENEQGYHILETLVSNDNKNITASGEPYTALVADIDADFISPKCKLTLSCTNKEKCPNGLTRLSTFSVIKWEIYDEN